MNKSMIFYEFFVNMNSIDKIKEPIFQGSLYNVIQLSEAQLPSLFVKQVSLHHAF